MFVLPFIWFMLAWLCTTFWKSINHARRMLKWALMWMIKLMEQRWFSNYLLLFLLSNINTKSWNIFFTETSGHPTRLYHQILQSSLHNKFRETATFCKVWKARNQKENIKTLNSLNHSTLHRRLFKVVPLVLNLDLNSIWCEYRWFETIQAVVEFVRTQF